MLVSGADFYMAPRVSPEGGKLAWVRSVPLHASALLDCHPPVCCFTLCTHPRQETLHKAVCAKATVG